MAAVGRSRYTHTGQLTTTQASFFAQITTRRPLGRPRKRRTDDLNRGKESVDVDNWNEANC